jgi:pimeloyl-ACP methyl ester carboxylesterase
VGWHERVDHGFARVMLPQHRLYRDGFGDPRVLDRCVRGVQDVSVEHVAPLAIDWTQSKSVRGVDVRRGTFTSPAPELPDDARRAVVEQWMPGRPGYLLLATTGEEGFFRRRLLARFLAAHGVGSVLLENPFYGERRPSGQRGPALRTVADQFAMNLATVLEARALLPELRGVTGFSQGGFMAAFASVVTPLELASVPRGAGCGVEAVFTSLALRHTMRWDVLAAQAGSLESARSTFAEALEPVRLDRFPPPRAPHRATLVAGRDDGFVPREEAERLHAHWPGSSLRWLPGGHVTSVVVYGRAQRRALLDTFHRA